MDELSDDELVGRYRAAPKSAEGQSAIEHLFRRHQNRVALSVVYILFRSFIHRHELETHGSGQPVRLQQLWTNCRQWLIRRAAEDHAAVAAGYDVLIPRLIDSDRLSPAGLE